MTEGRYGDTPFRFGGTDVIAVSDAETAIARGLSCPAPAHGVVEVRPLMSLG